MDFCALLFNDDADSCEAVKRRAGSTIGTLAEAIRSQGLQGGTDDLAKATMLGSPTLFFQTGANNIQFISFLYQDVLGRPVDTQSLHLSSNALAFGLTRGQLALDVLSTPEADLVEASNLYQTLLRRNADPAGLSFFANMLQRGTSDEAVIATMVSSDEYYQNAQAGF
jgi:hypothetical protein